MSCDKISNFITSTDLCQKLNIIGVSVGGSIAYRHAELGTINQAKDWDGLIFVQTKHDIVCLVNNYRVALRELLSIDREEFPGLKVPNSGKVFDAFDAVRFVGRTKENVKKGVKIMSTDFLFKIFAPETCYPSAINVYSFKDIRLYERGSTAVAEQRNDSTCILFQQASRVDENMVILNDRDLVLPDEKPKHLTGETTATMMFGVTADLLMNSIWIYDANHIADRLFQLLMNKFIRINPICLHPEHIICVFCRNREFQPQYRMWLLNRLSTLAENRSIVNCVAWKPGWYFFGDSCDLLQMIELSSRVKQNNIYRHPELINFNMLVSNSRWETLSSKFSSNSSFGRIVVCSGSSEQYFWKQTKFWKEEIAGAQMLSHYYNFLQQPLFIDPSSDIVLFPFFIGESLASNRLQYEIAMLNRTNSFNQSVAENLLLSAEMQRAEDMLRVYCSSAVVSDKHSFQINRFFYDRLEGNRRLIEFYEAGISFSTESSASTLSLRQLLDLTIIVNGKNYGRLRDRLKTAESLLMPDSFDGVISIIGMGDAHGGNVLQSTISNANSSHDIRYVDYEVAGNHSPLLDLAKPFYNDTFFSIFYGEQFGRSNPRVKLKSTLIAHTLSIDCRFCLSELSLAIYKIKTRYLLAPFFEYLKRKDMLHHLHRSTEWHAVLGSALFCCAILSRNYSSRPDIFLANLALGLILTGISDFTRVDASFFGLEDVAKCFEFCN